MQRLQYIEVALCWSFFVVLKFDCEVIESSQVWLLCLKIVQSNVSASRYEEHVLFVSNQIYY